MTIKVACEVRSSVDFSDDSAKLYVESAGSPWAGEVKLRLGEGEFWCYAQDLIDAVKRACLK